MSNFRKGFLATPRGQEATQEQYQANFKICWTGERQIRRGRLKPYGPTEILFHPDRLLSIEDQRIKLVNRKHPIEFDEPLKLTKVIRPQYGQKYKDHRRLCNEKKIEIILVLIALYICTRTS